MDLRDVRNRILPAIYEQAVNLLAGYPVSELGDTFDALSELFQGLGICYLLAEADTEMFRKFLVKSGHARRYFLRKSREQGNTQDRHLALSRNEAFLDVVVAGDLGLAREIAALTPETWNQNWEYEDDYCFFLFLHTLVQHPDPLPVEQLGGILARFEQVLEGNPSPRLSVCQALTASDAGEFASALQVLLEEKQGELDKLRPSVVDSKFLFWPRSFVSIEGLALLQSAAVAGLKIQEEFPLCPQDARFPTATTAYLDLFAELETVI